jgi:Fic family protein
LHRVSIRLAVQSKVALNEEQIQTIHHQMMEGKAKPSAYPDGQSVIGDSASGGIVYMPPEARDVPQLVAWIKGLCR